MPRSKSSSISQVTFSSFWDHPIATIEEALSIRKQIERLQTQLGQTLGSTTSSIARVVTGKGTGRRKVSPATLRKMRAAQQARRARTKEDVGDIPQPSLRAQIKKSGGKGGMTSQQRAKIAATMKARWAAKTKGAASAAKGSAASSKSASASPKKRDNSLRKGEPDWLPSCGLAGLRGRRMLPLQQRNSRLVSFSLWSW